MPSTFARRAERQQIRDVLFRQVARRELLVILPRPRPDLLLRPVRGCYIRLELL